MLKFTELHPHHLDTGDEVYLDKQAWDCVKPCIVIGHIGIDAVLQEAGGPKVNVDHLLKRGVLKTRGRSGQLPIEVLTLGAYTSASSAKKLLGKSIKAVQDLSHRLIIVCEDNTYCKFEIEQGYDGYELSYEFLTMADLYSMSLITECTHKEYQGQVEMKKADTKRRSGKRDLERAISTLGVETVRTLAGLARDKE